MSRKVFIGNVPFTAGDEDLQLWFSAQGARPAGVAIVRHRVTGKSRGFGFADFDRPEEAAAAVESLNGMELEGRRLMLSLAHSEGPAVQLAEKVGQGTA
jgi:RNA recognition motif-containing protein